VLAYRLDGPLFFAVADRFLREITATTAVRVVILRLGSVVMLDATGARVLGEIVEDLHRRGITVLVKGARPEHRRLLGAVGTLAPLVERGHVFATFPEAVAHAARHVVAEPAPGAVASNRQPCLTKG
jgi:SulP family sulfate permease